MTSPLNSLPEWIGQHKSELLVNFSFNTKIVQARKIRPRTQGICHVRVPHLVVASLLQPSCAWAPPAWVSVSRVPRSPAWGLALGAARPGTSPRGDFVFAPVHLF